MAASSGIQLIVGLGNPGPNYAGTRHNAGAWFIEQLAQSHHVSLKRENKFQGLHTIVRESGQEFHLFLPTTFMNLSGQAIMSVARFYQIAPENMLIAHDEIDLAVGDIRLKLNGGHGGHNGLRDIIKQLGTTQFHRLRIGVGHPGHSSEVSNYVLKAPAKTELTHIQDTLNAAENILPLLLAGEFQRATQELHTRTRI